MASSTTRSSATVLHTVESEGLPYHNQNYSEPSFYHNSFKSLSFSNENERFWWHATARSLSTLLSSSEYTTNDQQFYLQWFHRYIIGALGPQPISGIKPLFAPCPVFDGSAVEHSINWNERSFQRTVRFTMEATGFEAGTATDPFNQQETRRLLTRMRDDGLGVDLQHFDIFAQELFLPCNVAAELIPKLVSTRTPLSQAWMAFDLLRSTDEPEGRAPHAMAKVYFMPILKWILTGVPTKELVFAAARRCNGCHGSYDASIQELDDFLQSFPKGDDPVIEMVAIDCIAGPNSRIKMYLRTGVNTFAKAKHMYTLGGKLNGVVVEDGLKALEQLWPILFRLEGVDDVENYEVFPQGSYCGCAIEITPGTKQPETKLHIPVRKLQGTDSQLCDSLAAWFRLRGDEEFAVRYKGELEAAL